MKEKIEKEVLKLIFKNAYIYKTLTWSYSFLTADKCRSIDVKKRADCGWIGITKEVCEGRGCCYDDSGYNKRSKYCFHPKSEYTSTWSWWGFFSFRKTSVLFSNLILDFTTDYICEEEGLMAGGLNNYILFELISTRFHRRFLSRQVCFQSLLYNKQPLLRGCPQTISGSNFYANGAMLPRLDVRMTETLASVDSQINASNPFGLSCTFKLQLS